jgi:hypothetical protein
MHTAKRAARPRVKAGAKAKAAPAATSACTIIGSGVITAGSGSIHVENSMSTDTTTTEKLVLRNLTGTPAFFRLSTVTSASCKDDASYPPEETGAPVNYFDGTGTGSFGTSAGTVSPGYTISFEIGDLGDSSTGADNTKADVIAFKIFKGTTLVWSGRGNFNVGSEEIQETTGPPPPPPTGSCEPSSSIAPLVQGKNVVAYVPKGNWDEQEDDTGVDVVNVTGTTVTNKNVPTPNAVNSCASNPTTGETVCVSNGTDVYLFTGTTLTKTLTDGADTTGTAPDFSGGSCFTCSVVMDAPANLAVLGVATAGGPGFQVLNLTNNTFGAPVASPSGEISENPLVDPTRNLLLSASENNDFEIANVANPASFSFYENQASPPSGGEADSSFEDCSTGIAMAPYEFTDPSEVFIADLTQAKFTSGSPGSWTAPSQVQTLTESDGLIAGPTGSSVAQGTHTGLVTGEFGGNEFTALALPHTSGSGTPAIQDWLTCAVPNTPDANPWSQGDDPHTVTAYQDPTSGDAIALLANEGATWLAVVDLTKMLNSTDVPRTSGAGLGHACSSGTLPSSVVSFVSLP